MITKPRNSTILESFLLRDSRRNRVHEACFPGEEDVFAVLPGRPRRTLEGVHSTTVPHTALKSILASLSVRNLHRVVCRGSRTVDGKTHCLVRIGRRYHGPNRRTFDLSSRRFQYPDI